jgi:hypothetical protein
MNNPLETYKKNRINTLNISYNSSINILYFTLANNIKNIQRSRQTIRNKQAQINNSISQYNANVTILKNELNINIQSINNFIPQQIINVKNKTALLVGINYIKTSNELFGCINDSNSIKERIEKHGFNNINCMTDLTSKKPTRNNILNDLTSLLVNSKEGDFLVFFYSGHGSNTLDKNNDETDGRDETIIPCDLKPILDDELKQIIQKNLKTNVTLFAMFDACFSGTVLDLKYQYLDSLNYDNYTENSKTLDTLGNVFMISGCTDRQTSMDSIFNGRANGALTWSLLEVLNKNTTETISWRELIKAMRDLLKKYGFSQLPQFSSGKFIDIESNVFI